MPAVALGACPHAAGAWACDWASAVACWLLPRVTVDVHCSRELAVADPRSRFAMLPCDSKESVLASPCVRNCCLDEQDVCLGCGRALQEILDWQSASLTEREAILAAAKVRLALRRPFLPR